MVERRPPPLPPPDQMEIVQTHWGPMERWRAVAMCIGEISNVISRADANPGASSLDEEEKAPELFADDAAAARAVMAAALDAAHLAARREAILDRYRRKMARLDALEAKVDAEIAARDALARAEADPKGEASKLEPLPPKPPFDDTLPAAHPQWRTLH
jgi:hypothetical protein